ncbi:RNA polymerase sigma factor [Aquimarina sp. ERC-38]|uniref:RNA polymerase sigma factor n=1 Tax=Aquimarina sp. ERC-38 TaxID=2949996 RepID=UPI002247F0DF|nr:RNA polymerase sigma factor [Aquimarina sp. ERC-38]UZO82274.1 RNA polymerase sigma factor [Aquimarina sp. ERC-38]
MKIISLFTNEKALISNAKKGDHTAQHTLYQKYAPQMLAVCRRYVKDLQFAEDVSIQGFLKVFLQLHTYSGKGSFEGWVKRIMINESINFLKKKRSLVFDTNTEGYEKVTNSGITLKNDAEYLLKFIDRLPDNCRSIFILYAIDGYKHSEIAELLEIPESTSKSKLSKARKILQENIKNYKQRYESL